MPTRNQDGYQKFLHDFVNEILVVCPQCSGEAIVHSQLSIKNKKYEDIRVVCPGCGFNKTQKEIESRVFFSKMVNSKSILFGAPIDPFFKLPLKLLDAVNGNSFWAYNYAHLEFIRTIIDARLRERRSGSNFNGSIASRLPRWLTSKSNRETALKVIDRLKR